MKKLLFTLGTTAILLGIIGLGLNTIFGYGTITYLTRVRYGTMWFYKYDFWSYIETLKNAVSNVSELRLTIPELHYNDVLETLISILNIMIMILNVFAYPIRIAGYGIRLVMSLIGIKVVNTPTNYSLKWLTDTINVLISLQIPYVNV